jgi:hypothetical protein
MKPHELTQAQFKQMAQVVALVNHGRKWNVTLGDYASFSDAETAEAALVDVHHGAVSNALYFNEPDAPVIHEKPSLPYDWICADYPDLVERRNALITSSASAGKAESVFKATLERMTQADQKSIFLAQERCWREQNSGNAGSQHVADKLFGEAVATAVKRMLPSDRQYIESLCG